MAETRNTFIKSRMNKDLDARILPKGEYRDALNVAISRSNEDTVGALENVLGNVEISDFGIQRDLKINIINENGQLINATGTNWPVGPTLNIPTTGGSGSGLLVNVLGDGAGGIAVLEVVVSNTTENYQPGDIITFTDGPSEGSAEVSYVKDPTCINNLEIIGAKEDEANNRMFVFITDFVDDSKDNLSNTQGGGSHYICCYDFNSNTPYVLVQGDFLNFSKTQPVYGINIIEDFLFWTDNRNQPRKINISRAIADSTYYNKEWHISVAKPAPAEPIFPLVWYDLANPASFMVDAVSERLPNKNTPSTVGTANYFYDVDYKGEPEYFENKFLRFSYRFQYDDNEYSLIAPFSQACFIPKQDGFFIKRKNATPEIVQEDTLRTYKSTEVPFMENKVNRVNLQIPPMGENSGWISAKTDLHIKNIEIIVKESDGVALRKVATISIEDVIESRAAWNISPPANYANWFFEYVYDGKKPFEVLPDFEVTRVGEVAPIRALAQEIVGNRVVYGNFINQPTSPEGLNYTVSVQEKTDNQEISYQNQSLKQNRTYQVGVVLQDFYGRQSSVILSNFTNDDGQLSTVFNPYRNSNQVGNSFADNSGMWKGDSLAVNWITAIPEIIPDLEGWPGIFDINTNPLGWYAYKIVVQQTEQDYYNVYYPGALSGYINPYSAATPEDPIGHFVLHGDNINKVPRDLSEIGPEQNLFKSINVNTKAGRYETTAQWISYNKYAHHARYNKEGAASVQDIRGSGDKAQVLVDVDSQITDKDELNQIYSDEWDRIATQIRRGEGNIPNNSSTKLFQRVMNTSQLGNQQYCFGRNEFESKTPNYDTVVTIGKGQQLALYQLPVADPPTAITSANNFYTFADDPLIARVSIGAEETLPSAGAPPAAQFRIGYPSVGGAGLAPWGMYVSTPGFPSPGGDYMLPTLAIAETQPSVSNLDIYYETSTAGKVVPLNTAINSADTTSVKKLTDFNSSRPPQSQFNNAPLSIAYESSNSGSGAPVTLPFTPVNGSTFLNVGSTGVKLLKIVDGTGADVTQFFNLSYVNVLGPAPNDKFTLNINSNYYPVSYGDERDVYYVTMQCQASAPNSPITFINFWVSIFNSRPMASSPSTTSGTPYTANWSISTNGYNSPILKLYGNNGSSNPTELGSNCFWTMVDPTSTIDPSQYFELKNQKPSTNSTYLNQSEIGLYLKNTVTISDIGQKDFIIKLSDRDFPTNQEAEFHMRITIDT
tara:strand:- start:5140 stop:8820 length:3681 start_codon:yes stop_codon:yes gene_type:complete